MDENGNERQLQVIDVEARPTLSPDEERAALAFWVKELRSQVLALSDSNAKHNAENQTLRSDLAKAKARIIGLEAELKAARASVW